VLSAFLYGEQNGEDDAVFIMLQYGHHNSTGTPSHTPHYSWLFIFFIILFTLN